MIKLQFKITTCLFLCLSGEWEGFFSFRSEKIYIIHILFSLKLGVFSNEAFNYYDDEYYYDYEYKEPASKVQSKDYDLSELVKAWKEYIKEKNTEEKNYDCNPKDDSYRTPDSNQCDRYIS